MNNLNRMPGLARRNRNLSLIGLAMLAATVTGCSDDDLLDFRDASLNSIQLGVNAILGGIVDGAFAVFSSAQATNSD